MVAVKGCFENLLCAIGIFVFVKVNDYQFVLIRNTKKSIYCKTNQILGRRDREEEKEKNKQTDGQTDRRTDLLTDMNHFSLTADGVRNLLEVGR